MRIKLYDQGGISLGYMKVETLGETITLDGIDYQITHQQKLGDSLTKIVLKPIGEIKVKPVLTPKKVSWLKSIFRRIKR